MANTYADSVLLEARLWQEENVGTRFERRRTATQILPAFLAGQNYIPDIEAIKKATTQATAMLYLKKKDFTINSAKSCTPSGETGGSGKLSLTWTQKGFAVKHQTKKYHGNELSSIAGLAYDLYEAEATFWFGASGIDAILEAYLNTNRTQVNAISAGGGHNTWRGATDYDVTVAHADRGRFYNYLMAEMMMNNYSGILYDIHDQLWTADVGYYAAQGTANSVNTAFQFDNIIRKPSNLVVPTGYFNSKHYVFEEGAVAFLTWNEMLNREGRVAGDRQWTTMESKFFPGIFFDVFINTSCGDTTDDGGTTQDLVIDFEYTLNYTVAKQPLTTSNETPIFKYQVYAT